MEYIIFGLGILVAVFAGIYIGKSLSRAKLSETTGTLEERNKQLGFQLEQTTEQHGTTKTELNETREKSGLLQNELTRRNTEFENLQQKLIEQKGEVEKLNEKFTKEFENLANKILDEKSTKFTAQNKENIENVLKPLRENIKNFEEKVEKNSKDFTQRHAELGTQLKFLNEQNLKITEEANNLTKALKGDSQKQGAWGEIVLERILERSGLQEGSEYFKQQAFKNEEGRLVKPDFVIHLPGGKKLVIDSKVSLTAYENHCNAIENNDKLKYAKAHVASIQRHVVGLSEKNYHQLHQMESPDFVLLFIPIEAAFAVASNEYPQLYSDAFDKNIIIVTPTTLLAVLKTIESMWQNEKQKQNAIDIAMQAGALYDSFTNLTDELLKVGRQIGTVQTTYEGAMKKLTGKGNLVTRVEKLKKLGAKASKQIDRKLLSRAEGGEEIQDYLDLPKEQWPKTQL